jgi:hypothetical protein
MSIELTRQAHGKFCGIQLLFQTPGVHFFLLIVKAVDTSYIPLTRVAGKMFTRKYRTLLIGIWRLSLRGISVRRTTRLRQAAVPDRPD